MTDGRSSPDADSSVLLLVEDDPGDARLIEETLSSAVADRLRVVSTGEGALDFVNRRGEYVGAPRPNLVLLDWHLPDMDGEEVLAELTADPTHGYLPVVVLTDSQSERDTRTAYATHANACITKTPDPAGLEETLRVFERFWLSAARLPRPTDET